MKLEREKKAWQVILDKKMIKSKQDLTDLSDRQKLIDKQPTYC